MYVFIQSKTVDTLAKTPGDSAFPQPNPHDVTPTNVADPSLLATVNGPSLLSRISNIIV